MAFGTKCPYCDSVQSKIIDSRITKFGGRLRRRECRKCNNRNSTVEISMEVFKLLIASHYALKYIKRDPSSVVKRLVTLAEVKDTPSPDEVLNNERNT